MNRTSVCPVPRPLPALWWPIAVQDHPRAELINDRSNKWMREHRIVARDAEHMDRLEAYGFGLVAAKFFPNASLERAQLGAELICAWGFPVDDMIDDIDQDSDRVILRLNSLLRLLDAPGCPALDGDPLATAWVEARERLIRLATPEQIVRHAESWRNWFFGGACERAQRTIGRAGGTVPSLEENVPVRMFGVGAVVPMTFLEIAGDYRLTAAELAAPAVRALGEMMWMLCSWDNDIYSLPRDLTNGISNSNLVTILQHRDGTDVHEAVATALDMRNQVMALFLKLRDQILPDCSAALRLYLRDIGLQIAAYTDFWRNSSREKLEIDPRYADVLPAIEVDTSPDGIELGDPLPIPAIAWWWDCLAAPVAAGAARRTPAGR